MLSKGNTVPFIARYRKEEVIRLIDEKGLLTDELNNSIMNCVKLVDVAYKERKKIKATETSALGLEPLAKIIMSFPTTGDINCLCSKFIKDGLDTDKCIEGDKYIIAE